MKKFIIGALVCLNLALVAILVFHAGGQPAYAQARRGQANYMLTSGQLDRGEQVLYVIDTNRRMMGVFRLDTTRPDWRWKQLPPRDLSRDFPLERR